MTNSDARSPNAAEVYADFQRRFDAGERVDLDALCRAHPALESELRRRETMRRLLERALPGPLATDEVGSVAELLERLRRRPPAEQRYTVLHEIGRGGMGTVLRVLDTDLRRELAMKVARARPVGSQPSQSSAVHRFLEEAQITSQLDHPGIVPLHDVGLGADGQLFFTMRMVKGETLGSVFDRVAAGDAEWNLVRAVGVLLKVCDAMSYAHHERVVHRDLKPANVMVGRFGEVYVMDWGVAAVLGRREAPADPAAPAASESGGIDTERHPRDAESPGTPPLTRQGGALGTPSYMSPEQAEGRGKDIGPATDVYAVGAMLYHLIAGHMPYATEGATTPESVYELLRRRPPLPLLRFGRRAPPALVSICEKAMARAIGDRYQSMQEAAKDLRAFLEVRSVTAHATGTWAETRLWLRRNRALAGALAAAALLLIAGVVTFFLSQQRALRLESQASRRADVLTTLALLDELRRFESDWDVAIPAGSTARGLWLERVQEVLHGAAHPDRPDRPHAGLAEFRAFLDELRTQPVSGSAGTQAAPPFPRQNELAAKQRRLAWYGAMLQVPGASFQSIDANALAAETRGLGSFRLNQIAWNRVDPRNPIYGSEGEGLFYAERAIARLHCESVFRGWGAPLWWCGFLERHAGQLDTLAWALYGNRRFELALEQMRRVRLLKGAAGFPGYPRIESQIARWSDGSARLEYESLRREVDALDAAKRAWVSFRPQDAGAVLWHAQLADVVARLEQLASRLRANEQATDRRPYSRYSWSDAIASIRAHPLYHGLELTQQVDLVPLGPDPVTTLWEFGHLPSGEPPARDDQGRLAINVTTGLVFVLLPAATVEIRDGRPEEPRVPVDLDPFFLSKYETTQHQWMRLSGDSPDVFRWPAPMSPAFPISAHAAESALARAGGWLRLPSCAQWEYACWGLRSPGDWRDPKAAARRYPHTSEGTTIDETPPNERGFHDILGSVPETCCDDPTPVVTPRRGDGLRARRTNTYREVGCMDPSEGKDWNHVVHPDDRGQQGVRPARRLMP